MLKNKKLPQLIVQGHSSPFKKKPQQAKIEYDENNQIVITTLINKNMKQSHSIKPRRHKSEMRTERNRNIPLRQLNDEVYTYLKNKPYLRLDKIEYEGNPIKNKQKSKSTPSRSMLQDKRKFNQNYPRIKRYSEDLSHIRKLNGKCLQIRKCSLVHSNLRLPNQYQSFNQYLENNELNLSSAIRQKLIQTNFLKSKDQFGSNTQPLKLFS